MASRVRYRAAFAQNPALRVGKCRTAAGSAPVDSQKKHHGDSLCLQDTKTIPNVKSFVNKYQNFNKFHDYSMVNTFF